MPIKINEDREYQRYKHTAREKTFLESKGFVPVVSSNVSAIAKDGMALIIRFHHGGNTYAYPKSGNKFDDMLSAGSKGEFVWDELIRKKVPYFKTTQKVLKDGIPVEEDRPDPMQQSKADASEKSAAFLLGAGLKTVFTTEQALGMGLIASLALAQIINKTTRKRKRTATQA